MSKEKNLNNVYFRYQSDEEQFCSGYFSIADIIEHGPPTFLNGDERERWDDSLYISNPETRKFVIIADF